MRAFTHIFALALAACLLVACEPRMSTPGVFIIDANLSPTFTGTRTLSSYGEMKALTGVSIALATHRTEASAQRTVEMLASDSTGVLIRTRADYEHAVASGKLGIVLITQQRTPPQWQFAGDANVISRFADTGLRVINLAYSAQEAPSADERLGHAFDEGEDRGLTELGRQVVARANELGMLVDVSHCNEATTLEAARLSSKPVVATHANVRKVVDVMRNKSDAEIRAIAESGGVIGVTPIQWMTTADEARATVDQLVDHIDHIVELVGVNHVAIASDSRIDGWETDSNHRPGAQLNSAERWRHLTQRLRTRGYSEVEIAAIVGGNMQRVLLQTLR